jgi:hypothetical protein
MATVLNDYRANPMAVHDQDRMVLLEAYEEPIIPKLHLGYYVRLYRKMGYKIVNDNRKALEFKIATLLVKRKLHVIAYSSNSNKYDIKDYVNRNEGRSRLDKYPMLQYQDRKTILTLGVFGDNTSCEEFISRYYKKPDNVSYLVYCNNQDTKDFYSAFGKI